MAMSKDRVRFQLHAGMWQKGPQAYCGILNSAFGLSKGTYEVPYSGRPLNIVCRPSQFARFIIYRNKAIQQHRLDGVNTIAEMKPELFEPQPELPLEVDVSQN